MQARDRVRSAVLKIKSARRTTRFGAVLIVATVSFMLFVLASAHSVVANSDSATVVLEGKAIAAGNVTLNGWRLSYDSFWSIDALAYAVVAGLFGLHAGLVNVVPALLAALVVVVGVWAARDGLHGRSAAIAAATVIVLLCFPTYAFSSFFLQGPWHVGTALFCLVAFMSIRNGRFGFGLVVAIVLLGAGLLGDLQTLTLGVIPIFLAGVVWSARERSIRAGLVPIVTSLGSIVFAIALRAVTAAFGAFTVNESHNTAKVAQARHDVRHLVHWGASLLGLIRGPYGGPRATWPLELAHYAGLMVLVLAVCGGVVGLSRIAVRRPISREACRRYRLDDLLFFATLGDIATFEFLTLSNNTNYARYLTAGVVFAVILGARYVGRLVTLLRVRSVTYVFAAIGLVLSGCYVADYAVGASTTPPQQPIEALDQFLLSHHLTSGIGDYWASSVVTLTTGGQVVVWPVVANPSGKIVSDGRQTNRAWYNRSFQFLVDERAPYGRVTSKTIDQTFGPPAHVYRVGHYFINVWNHPLYLSSASFPTS